MKTRFVLLTMGAALIAGAFAFAGTENEESKSEPQLRRLREKISALESRVETLERKLKTPSVAPPPILRSGPSVIAPQPPAEFQPGLFMQPLPGEGQRPKIWGEREINGWKYYIIPCADRPATATELQPPKLISPK